MKPERDVELLGIAGRRLVYDRTAALVLGAIDRVGEHEWTAIAFARGLATPIESAMDMDEAVRAVLECWDDVTKSQVLSVAEVADLAGLPRRTIWTYVHRRRYSKSGHAGIPEPDARLADRPAWKAETIGPWLRERDG